MRTGNIIFGMLALLVILNVPSTVDAKDLTYEHYVSFSPYVGDVRFSDFVSENVTVINTDKDGGYFSVKVDGISMKNSGFMNVYIPSGSNFVFQIGSFQKSSFVNYEKDRPIKYHVIASTNPISEQEFINSDAEVKSNVNSDVKSNVNSEVKKSVNYLWANNTSYITPKVTTTTVQIKPMPVSSNVSIPTNSQPKPCQDPVSLYGAGRCYGYIAGRIVDGGVHGLWDGMTYGRSLNISFRSLMSNI